MLDNKNVAEWMLKTLANLSYEMKVNTYDKSCAECPFKSIKTVDDYGRETLHATLEDAINVVLYTKDRMIRGCGYGGDYFTLNEIIMNTCRLWNIKYIEGGDNEMIPSFIERINIGNKNAEVRDIRKDVTIENIPQQGSERHIPVSLTTAVVQQPTSETGLLHNERTPKCES